MKSEPVFSLNQLLEASIFDALDHMMKAKLYLTRARILMNKKGDWGPRMGFSAEEIKEAVHSAFCATDDQADKLRQIFEKV